MLETILAALLVVEIARHELDRWRWSKREDSLLNRIQAQNLQEFVAVERKPERIQLPKPDKGEDIPEGYTVIDRPEIDYAGVAAAERELGI